MAKPVPDRILIVRLGAIGDVVNALVVATAIKEARPDVQVGWAVHDLALPLVDGHPSVDRVHPWRRGSGVRGFNDFLRGIREQKYGLVIDLQRILKSALVARLSRAPRVLGFDRRRAKELSWLWTRERISPADPEAHMVRQYMEFVRYLGLPTSGPTHLLPTDVEAERWAEDFVGGLWNEPILINVGASKPENRWPPERFAELSRRCAVELERSICLTGGPDDRDVAAQVWSALAGVDGARNLVGTTSLLQLVALAKRARLFVGCDTGPMHLAAAVNTPVVALFGPANPGRTGPWGELNRVVRAPGVSAKMNDVGVDLVFSAVSELLLE